MNPAYFHNLFARRRSYLRADYAIDCSDTEEAWGGYKRVELLAWFGILLYPVGRPVGLSVYTQASVAHLKRLI